MSEIALTWDNEAFAADLSITANDLTTEEGFETSVFLSLFTDAPAQDGDVLPEGETERRGFWADAIPVVPGDKFGSRLWLLARSKDVAEVLTRAPILAKEALQWMLDDKVSDRVEVTAESVRLTGRDSVLILSPTIYRPKINPVTFRYHYNWVSQEARRIA